jgi:ABC-type spermidine/putrescine transport system permease subunit II
MDALIPILTAYVVIAGSSLAMYGLTRWPFTAAWFRDLGDWTKRMVHMGLALAIAFAAVAVGGQLGGETASALLVPVLGGFSVLTGGLVFRMGKSQPGNS